MQGRQNLQAIFGTRSENLKSDMEAYLRTAGPEADVAAITAPVAPAATAPDTSPPVAIGEDARRVAGEIIAAPVGCRISSSSRSGR